MSKMTDWLGGVGERASRMAERRRAAAAAAAEKSASTGQPAVEDAPQDTVAEPAAAARPPGPPPRPAPASVVPWGVRVAAEVGWRLLVLAGLIYVLMQVISVVSLVVIAFAVGLLVTALLQPTVARLRRWGFSQGLATATTFIGGFVAIGLIGWFVVWQIMENIDDLTDRIQQGIDDAQEWLIDGPFHVQEKQINNIGNEISDWLGENSSEVTSAGLEGVSYVLEFFSGAAIAAFVTLFLLYDGERIWRWCLNFVPTDARDAVAGAGPKVWATLTGYVRGTVLVALIDAVFIGIGIFILDVPMAVPLAVLIFLFAFVPLVGALVSGALAVVVAFVTNGLVTALLVLGVVLLVQQIEGHVLQPFILGRMVRVHPLAVVLSVAIGTLVAGIPGAVVAVPLIAVLNTAVGYLKAYHREHAADPGPPPYGSTVLEISPATPADTPAPGSDAETAEAAAATREGPEAEGGEPKG
ncbi:AI-2E family transporter [Streptomyces sp. NBC_01808]|uniref:AI-2E family transporter n=1 Tax=Streptomyces sp. NBC_01808 TaxID=2975947 RepID=UPI002DD7AEFD|nr:AI-2E family transporter [Streptomyces sp. NBC_01808]WSA40158.1 AI-2E family transporter [Streptomyces sp. NBC_01808]